MKNPFPLRSFLLKRWALCLLFFSLLAGSIWLVLAATTPSLPNSSSPLIFYSNQLRTDLKVLYCAALKEAKRSVHLQIYSLTDPEVLSLLAKKGAEGKTVAVHYDPKASGKIGNQLAPFASLYPYTGEGLMHKKILTIDEDKVFLGSANLTPSSLRMHDNLVIGIHSSPLAHFLQTAPSASLSFPIGEQRGEVWLLPEGGQEALSRLLSLIQEAKKSIYLSMFTFTHPLLNQALIQAHQRGVKVRCAFDYYSGRGASSKNLRSLQAAGIPVYLNQGPQLMHHKWALIDGSTLVAGSANWTKAAFEKNQDCFLIFSPLERSQKTFLKKMWKILELESELFYK